MASVKARIWHENTDNLTAFRRAGGRRAYNRRRKKLAEERRLLVKETFTHRWGDVSRLALAFGVSVRTIRADLRACGVARGWQRIGGSRQRIGDDHSKLQEIGGGWVAREWKRLNRLLAELDAEEGP
jgi:hypothetical protein